ncbi:MAG: hypothetical protein JXR80_09290 [Deltaproteobacteria bacterium]|nr:hypothetical protein [Deltaproteobacteria bacterium]
MYQKLVGGPQSDEKDNWLSHEVVRAVIIKLLSLIRAWREHLGMTLAELV